MRLPSGTFAQSYDQDMALVRTKGQWVFMAVLMVFLFTIPQWASNSTLTLATLMGITIISVHGLNILTGNCGLVSHGTLGLHDGGRLCHGHPVLQSRTAVLRLPSYLRVDRGHGGHHLRSAFPEDQGFLPDHVHGGGLFHHPLAGVAVPRLDRRYRGLGGAAGRRLFGLSLEGKATFFYLVMALAVLATIVAKNILRTRSGRAFVAIRDNDLAAEVMGVNLWTYKLQAFFIGCVFAGIAGALSVEFFSFANVEQFPFFDSVWFLGMLIIGGMGSVSGVIYGVVAIKLLQQLSIKLGPMLEGVLNPQAAVGWALSCPVLAIILFLIFAPRGISHIVERVKNYYQLWPF